MNIKHTLVPVLAGAGVLLLLGSVGGAVAATQIGSTGIRDDSLRSIDLQDGRAVALRDLTPSARDALSEPGPVGPAGPTGPAGQDGQDGAAGQDGQDGAAGAPGADGADGVSGLEKVSGDPTVVSGAKYATITIACPTGKVAIAAGLVQPDPDLDVMNTEPDLAAGSIEVRVHNTSGNDANAQGYALCILAN